MVEVQPSHVSSQNQQWWLCRTQSKKKNQEYQTVENTQNYEIISLPSNRSSKPIGL